MNKAWLVSSLSISVNSSYLNSNSTLNSLLSRTKRSTNALADLDYYGCWCFTDQDYVKGQGEPVDAFDKLCKKLHDDYDTAIGPLPEISCSPSTQKYETSNSGWSVQEITEECETKNSENRCAVFSCIAEGTFITEFFQLLWSGKKPDKRKIHANGFFPEEMCLLEHGHQKLESIPVVAEMQYGCYCRPAFGDKYSRMGTPVDGVDTACQYYQEKLEEIGVLCPGKVSYKSNVVFHGHVDIECESKKIK